MKAIEITHVADAGEFIAAVKAAQLGAAFRLSLGTSANAVLTLTALCDAAADPNDVPLGTACRPIRAATGISKLKRAELIPEITERIASGRARSIHAAAFQLAKENRLPLGGTIENQANYLGRLARKALSASAFLQNTERNSKDLPAAACDSVVDTEKTAKENRMAAQEEKALGPDRLKRVIPRHWQINLDAEGLSDVLPAEVLNHAFWIEGTGRLDYGDVVSLSRAAAPTLHVQIGQPHPDGGFFVHDITGSFNVHEAAA